MIRQLNITDYTYKKIIKEFQLQRCKTNKINRFKASNGIEIENKTKQIEANDIVNNIEVVKTNNNQNNQDIITKVKETLAKSKASRKTTRKY